MDFSTPLEFLKKKARQTHDGGQMKAIIISWIIMNIFITLMKAWSWSRYGFSWRNKTKRPRHETDSTEIILHDHE